jgi:LysR family nitrogen assimilation transcriptional regulator
LDAVDRRERHQSNNGISVDHSQIGYLDEIALAPRHIALVLSISQHGPLTAAATALHTSQPALSNRVTMLQRELGAQVFNRNRYGVTLTEAGKLPLRHAKAMDTLLAQAREEIELKKRGSEGAACGRDHSGFRL